MKVAVVSPHLDDGVFSLGATMSALSRARVDVRLVTLFAGDPHDHGETSFHDRLRGAGTIAEATAARRDEDQQACDVLGIESLWCDNLDAAYLSARDPARVWECLRGHLHNADLVFIPGFPLTHYDHSYTSLLVLRELHSVPLALYGEIPYLATPKMLARGRWSGRRAQALGNSDREFAEWISLCPTEADWERKRRAVHCYRGELAALGKLGAAGVVYDRLIRREVVRPETGKSLPGPIVRLRASARLGFPPRNVRARAPR